MIDGVPPNELCTLMVIDDNEMCFIDSPQLEQLYITIDNITVLSATFITSISVTPAAITTSTSVAIITSTTSTSWSQ